MVYSKTKSMVCMAALGMFAPLCALAQVIPAPSGLAGYQPYADAAVGSWRESNDRVRQVGGWRAYARQVQGTTAPTSGATTPGAPSGAAPSTVLPQASPLEPKP